MERSSVDLRWLRRGVIGWVSLVGIVSVSGSDPAHSSDQPTGSHAVPTLGGRQFWSDHLVLHDWRIQQHIGTGHFRLLDGADRRHHFGTFDACRERLNQLRTQLELAPLSPHVVLVLHGLGRSRKSMDGLARYAREISDFSVLNISYASTRGRIEQHAESVAAVIRHLPDETKIHFIGHSMGNLVIRHFLGDLLHAQDQHSRDVLKRIGRIVMLAPPNRGAMLAERFQKNPVFRLVWGTSGRQIAEWATLEVKLAVPPGEFGIIAGGKSDRKGHNPLIEGDDDFVVSVVETQLAGASDFIVIPTVHAVMMDHPDVRAASLRFLLEGHFVSKESRQPIAASGAPRD